MTKIVINNKIFDYNPEVLTYETAVPLNLADAKENLLLFKKAADTQNLFFLLYYGTLLGVIRETNFIKHDIDIDVVTNDETSLQNIIPILNEYGFSFIRYETTKSLHSFTTVYSFRRKSVYIDVYIAYFEKQKKCYNLLGSYIPCKWIDETTMISFLENDFQIPKDYIKILETLYGKNWTIPIIHQPGDFKKDKLLKDRIRDCIFYLINRLKRILKRIFPKIYIKIKHLVKKKSFLDNHHQP
ncbi:hypothetical protein H0R92_00905 [Treponema sp. OMZ 840]|uniref:hypothetical protein n=1 Tax=Treponema sp. OMZ 840 TaxID=244313 RepID=UPI003D92156B